MIIFVLVLVVVVNVVAKDVADNVVVYSAVVVAVAVLACSFSFSDLVDVNVFDLIGMDLVAFVIKLSLEVIDFFGPDVLNIFKSIWFPVVVLIDGPIDTFEDVSLTANIF